MTASTTALYQPPFAERILEAVLLSLEPVGARDVTAKLYEEVTSVRIANVRRALHDLAQEGMLACVAQDGKERLAWAAPSVSACH